VQVSVPESHNDTSIQIILHRWPQRHQPLRRVFIHTSKRARVSMLLSSPHSRLLQVAEGEHVYSHLSVPRGILCHLLCKSVEERAGVVVT
jgi:hypothetical protein